MTLRFSDKSREVKGREGEMAETKQNKKRMKKGEIIHSLAIYLDSSNSPEGFISSAERENGIKTNGSEEEVKRKEGKTNHSTSSNV